MALNDKKAVSIKVPTKGEEEKQQKEKKARLKKKEDLTEEELKRKEELELMITRLTDPDENVVVLALDLLNKEIINTSGLLSSSLLTLKVLKTHYNVFLDIYKQMSWPNCKRKLSNMISALSASVGDEKNVVRYLISGNKEELINYGHEYIKNVITNLLVEYKNLKEDEISMNLSTTTNVAKERLEKLNHIYDLVNIIVPYCFKHNTEYEAIDLLLEVDKISDIAIYVNQESCDRSILYLLNLTHYCSSSEEYYKILEVMLVILTKYNKPIECLKILFRLNRRDKIKETVLNCPDEIVQKQMALVCARHNVQLDFQDDEIVADGKNSDHLRELRSLSSAEQLSVFFLRLAKDLDVEEPKLPEDVYKSHLEEKRNTAAWDSAKQNLSSSFVNAFVNAGFCKDKLMTVDSSVWIYKNKDIGMLSATASMGLLFLWNVEEGLSQIDKFLYSNDANVRSGALMAFGLVCTNVRLDYDPAYALLSEHVDSSNVMEKIASILGFGFAHAGTNRDLLMEVLVPSLVDVSMGIDCSVFAAVSLGLIYVGSQNREVAEYIIDTIIEREKIEKSLDSGIAKLYGVALGLLFLCSREKCEAILSALEIIKHPIAKYLIITVEGMAFAGSNDVLKVQKMLHACVNKNEKKSETESNVETPVNGTVSEIKINKETGTKLPEVKIVDTQEENAKAENSDIKKEVAKMMKGLKKIPVTNHNNKEDSVEDDLEQCVAILNIALIALTDEISTEMTIRNFDHFLQFANAKQKKAVPLAFALLFASFPKPTIVDILSKLTHDQDADVALNAIISLGIVGAGTNNSKIAVLLRQLSAFYCKDSSAIFVIRLAQGLLYMGKGLLTINPLYSNRSVINHVALGSLIVAIHAFLQLKYTMFGKYHYLLYFLVPAIYPRMLITVDEKMNPLPVAVRVGQAVDVVAQAGKPKTITGFQTHTTPVLLLHTDRAELATDEYVAVTETLEGIVILKKNPEYVPPIH